MKKRKGKSKKKKHDINNASLENMDAMLDQYNLKEKKCKECEHAKEDHTSILQEWKGMEEHALSLSQDARKLQINAWYDE